MESSDQTHLHRAKGKTKLKLWVFLGLAAVVVFMAGTTVLPRLRRHGESVSCGNYMAAIGVASRLWANGNNGRAPSNLLSMSNELSSPKVLICPGDHSRKAAASWASFTSANSSYEIVNAGLAESDTNTVFLRCKIHGHLGYVDGTVFDGEQRRTKKFW